MLRLSIAVTLMIGLCTRPCGAAEPPLKIVLAESHSKTQFEKYRAYLEENYDVTCKLVHADKSKKEMSESAFVGVEAFEDCDVILSNLYRTWGAAGQMPTITQAFLSKPVVGMRRSGHGFQNWLTADKEVFGVEYHGHYKGDILRLTDIAQNDSVLEGFEPFAPGGGIYRHLDPAADVRVLMVGGPTNDALQPQMWSRVVKDRGNQRVLYTRYDPGDLTQSEAVRDLVTRALFWAVNKDMQAYRK